MSRNLDTPEEEFIIRVMSIAAADPQITSMAYRLANGTPRSYFTSEQANKLRLLVKRLIDDMNKLKETE